MNICPKCGVEKTDQNTNRRKFLSEEGYFDAYCRGCRRAKSSEYRQKYPERRRASDKKSYQRFQTVLQGLKNERPCYDCGGDFPPECKDWDHVRGEKCFNVGEGWSHSFDKFRQEIEKCDLVCANCHRIRTKKRYA